MSDHDLNELATEMAKLVRWHDYRPWSGFDPGPPEDVVDACGACARAKVEHPTPWLLLQWPESIAVARLVLRAAPGRKVTA